MWAVDYLGFGLSVALLPICYYGQKSRQPGSDEVAWRLKMVWAT